MTWTEIGLLFAGVFLAVGVLSIFEEWLEEWRRDK